MPFDLSVTINLGTKSTEQLCTRTVNLFTPPGEIKQRANHEARLGEAHVLT